VFAVLAALSLAACASHPIDPTPGGIPSAPPSQEGGAPDVGPKVPDYDGPSWTGTVPHPGVWRAVAGLPEGCGVRLSATPTVSIPSLEWKACASGEADCHEAPLPTALGYPGHAENATFHEDARGVHVWLDIHGVDAKWSIMWNLAGPTELVAYSPRGQGCVLGVGSSARGYEMYAGINLTYETHSYAVRAPHDAPLRTTVTTLSSALYLTGALRWLGYGDAFVFTGRRIVPLEAGPSSPPLARDVYAAATLVAVRGGVLAVHSAVGTSQFVNFYPATGGSPTVVLPVPASHAVEYLGVEPASGELIRVESEGPTHETIRVYASPVATESLSWAPLVSRLVARVPPTIFDAPRVALNAGALFIGPSAERPSRLIRLSDGAHWEVGSVKEAPLFVTRDQVFTVEEKAPPAHNEWTFRRRPFPRSAPVPAER